MSKYRLIRQLQSRGFDACYSVRGGGVGVRCSQCEALVINGIACHEQSCPNERKINEIHTR